MIKLLKKQPKGILDTGRLVISFAVIFLILVSLVVINSMNSSAKEKSAFWIQHTKDVIHNSERVSTILTAIENNSRAFIITGWDFFMDSTESSDADIRIAISQLRKATVDNPAQQKRIKELESLVEDRLTFTYKTIQLRKNDGIEAARKLMETKKGVEISEKIQLKINEIQDEEEKLLSERIGVNEKYLEYSRILTLVIQIFLFLMLALILLLMIRGVKAQKESEKILRTSGEWFSRTLSGIGDGVIATDENGVVTYMNAVAESLTGWSNEDSKGKSVDIIFDVINSETRKPASNPVKTVIGERRIVELEKNTLLIRKDKREVPVDDSAAPLFDEEGKLLGVVLVFRDVEKQRAAERIILKSNERFTSVFNLSPVAICITDVVSGKIVLYNSAFIKLFKIDNDSLTGDLLSDVVDLTNVEADNSVNVSVWGETKNIVINRQKIELDNRLCNVLVLVDNTERKRLFGELESLNRQLEEKVILRTDEAMRAEKKFRSLIEHNNDIILLSDEDGEVTYVSPSLERVLGWSSDEYRKMFGFVLVHTDDLQHIRDLYVKVISNPGVPFHTLHRVKNKQGEFLWMEGYYTNLLNDPDINAIVTNLHNATERINAIEEIKQGRKRLENILQTMGDAFVSLDYNWRYTFVNERALQLMGKKENQLLGNKLFDVFPDVIGTDFETHFRKVMDKRVQSSFEIFYPSYNMWLNVRVYPHDGGIAVFYTDISNEKNSQQEITKLNLDLEKKVQERTRELEEANRELESFSYSVSHDLRAPLRAIYGYTSILQEEFADKLDDTGNKYVSTVLKNAKYMGQLIDDLLLFSKISRQNIRRVMLDMDKLVKGISDAQKELASSQKIEFDIKPLINVLGDESMIKQVMQNLISNAIKYSSKKDVSRIEIGAYTQSGFTTFFVKDNGAGFEMEYYDKLFAVFQRLHARTEFEGTGVGLALVNRIIQKHGGKVWAESEVEKGATFYFSLPNQ